MSTSTPEHRTRAVPADLASAWVLAGRDDERRAWEALYDALHPRPVRDGGTR